MVTIILVYNRYGEEQNSHKQNVAGGKCVTKQKHKDAQQAQGENTHDAGQEVGEVYQPSKFLWQIIRVKKALQCVHRSGSSFSFAKDCSFAKQILAHYTLLLHVIQ